MSIISVTKKAFYILIVCSIFAVLFFALVLIVLLIRYSKSKRWLLRTYIYSNKDKQFISLIFDNNQLFYVKGEKSCILISFFPETIQNIFIMKHSIIFQNKNRLLLLPKTPEFVTYLSPTFQKNESIFIKKVDVSRRINKEISLLLFFLALFSLPLSLATLYFGDVMMFGIPGILEYTWISYIFVFLPLASVFFGIFSYIKKGTYKKNIIAGSLLILFLSLIGSSKYMASNNISYNDSFLVRVENKTEIYFPSKRKASCMLNDNKISGRSTYGNAIFLDEIEIDSFVSNINQNIWRPVFTDFILNNTVAKYSFDKYDYCFSYVDTIKIFNPQSLEKGTYYITMVTYDIKQNHLCILDDFEIIIK